MAWLSGWCKRIKITIDADLVDAALSDFPVPVYISAASGIGDVDASCVFDELASDSNRKKIAVTTSDGETQCYVEIERWDHANEKAWLHVKVPSISASTDTDFYLYYDRFQSDNTTYVGDTTDTAAQNVWDSSFGGVWHMGQDPNGDATNAIKDSTSNAKHMTPHGSMTTSDLVDGIFGKAIDFDGSNDYLSSANWISGISTVTLEAIAKATVWGVNPGRCLVVAGAAATGQGVPISEDGTSGIYNCGIYGDDMSSNVSIVNDWRHLALRVGSGYAQFFENATGSATNAVSLNLGTGYIGVCGAWNSRYFGAIVSEVRVSSVARSTAWIKATYNGLFDSLLTFSAEEVPYTLSGVVTESSTGVARTVRVYDRATGALLAETISSSEDGSFSIPIYSNDPVYVVALDDDSGDDYNAIIFDRVIPIEGN